MEGSFPFTVVLKAPDGTVADVLVDCSSDWNVSQLKLHICDVYPTRPDPQNQKLIHAGHLLQDGQVLRDAIRQAELNSVQTVHLIVAPTPGQPHLATSPVHGSASAAPSTPAVAAASDVLPSPPSAVRSSLPQVPVTGQQTPPSPLAPPPSSAAVLSPAAPRIEVSSAPAPQSPSPSLTTHSPSPATSPDTNVAREAAAALRLAAAMRRYSPNTRSPEVHRREAPASPAETRHSATTSSSVPLTSPAMPSPSASSETSVGQDGPGTSLSDLATAGDPSLTTNSISDSKHYVTTSEKKCPSAPAATSSSSSTPSTSTSSPSRPDVYAELYQYYYNYYFQTYFHHSALSVHAPPGLEDYYRKVRGHYESIGLQAPAPYASAAAPHAPFLLPTTATATPSAAPPAHDAPLPNAEAGANNLNNNQGDNNADANAAPPVLNVLPDEFDDDEQAFEREEETNQVTIIAKLALLLYIFGQHASSKRLACMCVAAVIVFLYQTGRLNRWVGPAAPPPEANAEQPPAEPQQREPAAPQPTPPHLHDEADTPPSQQASGVHTVPHTERGESSPALSGVHTLRNAETGETSSASSSGEHSDSTPPSCTPPAATPAVQIQVQPSLVDELEQFVINFFSSLLPGREVNNNNNNNQQQNQNMPVGGLFG